MTPALLTLFSQAQAHRLEHGCSAHPFGDGAALYDLADKLQAKHILELGTGVGYTAVLLATACPHAQIDTLEGEMTHVQLAQDLFKRLALEEHTPACRLLCRHFGATAHRALQLGFF